MNKLAIIVPFKSKGHKSRLRARFSEQERTELARMMLRHVLGTVLRSGLGESCFVVTSDEEAMGEARSRGASSIREKEDAGVNTAVRSALRRLKTFERFMVIPSDLPRLQTSDLTSAITLGDSLDIVLSPSATFTGTNLLLFSRSHALPLSYDDNSFWNHLSGASSKGLTVAVYAGKGVTLDLDTAGDARRLIGLGPANELTNFLRERMR